MISYYKDSDDATLEVDLAEVDLGDVDMADAIRQLRHIARLHRNKRICLRELATWLKARNKAFDPESVGPDALALRNDALAAADADRLKSEEAERVAIATQADREAAEAAEKAAHDKAKAASQALASKQAEELLALEREGS